MWKLVGLLIPTGTGPKINLSTVSFERSVSNRDVRSEKCKIVRGNSIFPISRSILGQNSYSLILSLVTGENNQYRPLDFPLLKEIYVRIISTRRVNVLPKTSFAK